MKSQLSFTNKPYGRFIITLITALCGGVAFNLIESPIPWLLGPMFAVLIGSSIWKDRYEWPGQVRNTGMIIIGYTIGLSMTATALQEMSQQLPYMLLMTVLLLLLCAVIAYGVSRASSSDFLTSLMGSIPGGLTQIIILAEETKGINITIVTVTQVIRLMMIVVCIPLLIFSPLLGQHHTRNIETQLVTADPAAWSHLFPNILLFALVCIVFALLGNRIKLPTAYFLGPVIGTAILQIAGLFGPALPPLIIGAAQLTIGIYVVLLLKPGRINQRVRTITLAIISGFVLLAGTVGLALLLTKLQNISVSTALLSLAPGGMDQMGIIAHEINADLSMVAGFQLFRTFFIFFAIPPILRMIIKYELKRRTSSSST